MENFIFRATTPGFMMFSGGMGGELHILNSQYILYIIQHFFMQQQCEPSTKPLQILLCQYFDSLSDKLPASFCHKKQK